MRTGRPYGIASLFVAAGLALAGCQTAASGSEAEEAIAAAASVEATRTAGRRRCTLTEEAVERLRLETAPVTGGDGGSSDALRRGGLRRGRRDLGVRRARTGVYQRAAITIDSIDGDTSGSETAPSPAPRS